MICNPGRVQHARSDGGEQKPVLAPAFVRSGDGERLSYWNG
jgi:hypothetical protein